jgi:hypothetical protein
MNEMYSMGLSIHSWGAVLIFGSIVLNILVLNGAKDLQKYKRVMSIYLMPLSSTVIGVAIFSGTIMMAAKHLDFTLENVVMIIISVVLIVLEAKRAKTLKYLSVKTQNSLEVYKPYGIKILYIELVVSVLISLWMWSIA